MKFKTLIKATLIVLALVMTGAEAYGQKYVVYPTPRSITMKSGSLALTKKVNVIAENGVDQITKNRLKSVLEVYGMECLFGGKDADCMTIRLGIVGSGEEVETHAYENEGMTKTKIMVSKKFDRHAISVSEHGITILGEHTNAVFFGLATLEQILEQQHDGALGYTLIYDRADQQNRGLVEGYYGYPYSVEVKKDLMRYMMRYKMNTYMYGAKSDPYHSQMWKDAYPTSISAQQEKNGWLTQKMVEDIAKVSEETKVNFIWAIHPGNEFLGSSTVISDIMSKFEKMHSLGVRHFGVFVDDVSIPSSDADMKKNADRLMSLQKAIEDKWNTDEAAPEDTVRPLHFVPQIYCNSFASSVDQRQRFMTALSKVPSYITVYSTGQGVWSVPNNDHTATIVNEFGRPMAWWWNYPCNDNADGQLYPMDMYSNFVDMPAVGDGERLPSTLNNCQGIIANPMQQGELAKTSLFSIADYAWNNAGFNNNNSWEASFKSLIANEEIREAYHDITYYLRWNEPESMKTLINNYKSSLEKGAPNATKLLDAIVKIKTDCEKVIQLKDSEIQSDRLLYTDIAPWLHTLHTYSQVVEKMITVLGNTPEQKEESWLLVKEVSDSLAALENSTLYTAYALEGMGNGISVSERQAQLSRKYLYPFIAYLKEKAIDTFFYDPSAQSAPVAISNSPLLNAEVLSHGANVALNLKPSNLDVNTYVGVALPEPIIIDGISIDESILPYAQYSSNGKDWESVESAESVVGKHVAYFIFINETGQGVKEFSLSPETFSLALASVAKIESATIPSGTIYENHDASLMIDGRYDTYTCLKRNQASGDNYLIDLGDKVAIHDVRLCMGTVNGDYPTTARMEYSVGGLTWKSMKIMGTNSTSWSIDAEQNVRYNDEMVYCDFDGTGVKARYVRLVLSKPNTNKWMRIYEIEVNRLHAENSTLAQCKDETGKALRELTDKDPKTGVSKGVTGPLTYSFNSQHDIKGVHIFALPANVEAGISVTTSGQEKEVVGALTKAYQYVDLKAFPKASAMHIEWEGDEAPAIYEMIPEYDTSTSSLPNEVSELSEAFALLKAKSLHALDSCGKGDKLITKNSQFSSPYTESKEGSLNNLLDGNQSTFWHSAWSQGNVADGVHYLEIKLPEGTVGDVVMHYGRRSDTDGHHLIKAKILGVVSGSGTSAKTEEVCQLNMPLSSQRETVVRSFTLAKEYSAIRLLELETSGSMNGGSEGFFHVGEFQLYAMQKYYIIKDAQAEADALLEATMPLPSEATKEDLATLQKAYEAFMYKVFGIVPSGINDVNSSLGNGGKTYIFDVSGRRVSHPNQNGVYIINNKKVIVK